MTRFICPQIIATTCFDVLTNSVILSGNTFARVIPSTWWWHDDDGTAVCDVTLDAVCVCDKCYYPFPTIIQRNTQEKIPTSGLWRGWRNHPVLFRMGSGRMSLTSRRMCHQSSLANEEARRIFSTLEYEMYDHLNEVVCERKRERDIDNKIRIMFHILAAFLIYCSAEVCNLTARSEENYEGNWCQVVNGPSFTLNGIDRSLKVQF